MKFIKKVLSTTVIVFIACCVIGWYFGLNDTAEVGGRSSAPSASSSSSWDSEETAWEDNGAWDTSDASDAADASDYYGQDESAGVEERGKIIEIPDLSGIEHSDDYIRPEFRRAMEEYVEFYREYCEFMKKYNGSNNTLGMLADYSKIIKELAEMDAALAAIGEEERTLAETYLYIDTTTEIQKLLLELYE